jgi:hypothetical protein
VLRHRSWSSSPRSRSTPSSRRGPSSPLTGRGRRRHLPLKWLQEHRRGDAAEEHVNSAAGTGGRHLPPGLGPERDPEQEAWRLGGSEGRSPTFEQAEQRRRVLGCGSLGTVSASSRTRSDFGPNAVTNSKGSLVEPPPTVVVQAAMSSSRRSCARLARRPRNRGIARGSSLHCRCLRSTMDRHVRGAPAQLMCDLAAEKRESVARIGE